MEEWMLCNFSSTIAIDSSLNRILALLHTEVVVLIVLVFCCLMTIKQKRLRCRGQLLLRLVALMLMCFSDIEKTLDSAFLHMVGMWLLYALGMKAKYKRKVHPPQVFITCAHSEKPISIDDSISYSRCTIWSAMEIRLFYPRCKARNNL